MPSYLFRKIAAMAFLLGTVTACSSVDTAKWFEEIELSTGQVIVVTRVSRAHSNGFPNASRGSDIDYSLEYPAGKVKWQGPVMNQPLAFDVIDGRIFLVVIHGDGHMCKSNSADEVSASFLEWVSGQWVVRSLASVPVDRMQINLYSRYWGHTPKTDAEGLITLTHKATSDGDRFRMPLADYFKYGFLSCKWLLKSK